MDDKSCKKCAEREEAWDMLFQVKDMLASVDTMIYQATEAGLDQGRIVGLLEAATALEKAGYGELGAIIRKLVQEDVMILGKHDGEA
jgi:hypothetical protein